jgi:hypothetical protein
MGKIKIDITYEVEVDDVSDYIFDCGVDNGEELKAVIKSKCNNDLTSFLNFFHPILVKFKMWI